MALIIDERIAGGRPQKRPVPSAAPVRAAAERLVATATDLAARSRPTRRIVIWARA